VQELGGSTVRQTAKLANGNIAYHRHHAQFINGGWPGGRKHSALLFFKSSLDREYKLFQEFCEICEIREFGIP